MDASSSFPAFQQEVIGQPSADLKSLSDQQQEDLFNARQFNTLPELFLKQAARFGGKPLFWQKPKKADEWHGTSWEKAERDARSLARWLISKGVQKGDRIILVAENRTEWAVADLGIMMAGAYTVPAYTTHTEDDHRHLMQDSGAIGIICANDRLLERASPAASDSQNCAWAVMIDSSAAESTDTLPLFDWSTVLAEGLSLPPGEDARIAELGKEDIACIIYTSGTGGTPKGVMLSHRAILHNCIGAHDILLDLGLDQEVFLSFLPLSHAYEHSAGLYYPILCGAEIYYAESVEKLLPAMAEVRPTIMTAVPRLYETIYKRISQGAKSASGLQQALLARTVSLGTKQLRHPGSLNPLEKLQNLVLDKLVRKKVRARFGGRLKALVSGGAALNPEIGEYLLALGLPILQGYGQTETGPVVSVNRPGIEVPECVGAPLDNTSVRIAEDGEILISGDLVMSGYWNNPEATAGTLKDGWVYTGDVGVITERGHIRITDRKKDIIVLSGGENVAPARIEGLLTKSGTIQQAVVFGDRQKHLVAILVPSEDFLDRWGEANDLAALLSEVHDNPSLTLSLAKVVDSVNSRVQPHEKVRRFIIAPESFTIENSLMTPTLKVRRHKIFERYGDQINALFGSA
ncbi:AMP-dependent synthetase/ligase [Kiloniella sp. b19]|uniref:AMP-dependent synthetase/ligase n=1 Tax=Kiloniella sp. GXU_MW_B19 TaxID=3141326 RepID=UPI0031E20B90